MTAAQWAWIISLAVAVMLGWLTARFDDQKKAIASLVGLVVASIGGTVALYFETTAIRDDQSAVLGHVVPTLRSPIWNAVVQDIAEYDRQNPGSPLEEILNEPLRLAISRSINEAREGYIEIPDKNEVVVVTLRLLDKAQQSVRATSYIDPKQWWGSDLALTYSEGLTTTKQRVKVFQRIFIVNSRTEAKTLEPIMSAQAKAGLEVRYLCGVGIPADQREDFIIVDSSVAAEMVLGEERQFRSARFFSTKVRAEDFERRFDSLWVGARRLSDENEFECPP